MFANGTGASVCTVCPAGYECVNNPKAALPCPIGYYCLKGDDKVNKGIKVLCPDGTYGGSEFLQNEAMCTICPGGKYCIKGENKGNYTGICEPKYYCPPKSTIPQQKPCPEGGYYCPRGSTIPLPCFPGYYSQVGKLEAADQCTKCTAGQYCENGTQSTPTGYCAEGWFCNVGSPHSQPTNSTYGGECPPGSYCTNGMKKPCEAGTYANISGQYSCNKCPEGFYCELGSISPKECPIGYWCEASSMLPYQNPCPEGTFNHLHQRTSRSDCRDCTPGYFCNTTGMYLIVLALKHS